MVCVGGLVKNGVVFLTKGTPDMRANSVGQQSGDLQKKNKKPYRRRLVSWCVIDAFAAYSAIYI